MRTIAMPNRDVHVLALSLSLATAILLGDLFIPLDVAGGVLYVVAVLVTLWNSNRHAATAVAAVSTGFLFLGGLLQEASGSAIVDVLNRVFGLLAIWLTALLVQERKVVENRLKKNESQIRSILNGTADAIVSLDEHGRILSVNPAAARIFGYAPVELARLEITELTTAPFAPELAEYLRHALEHGRDGGGREVAGIRKDGSIFPMHVRLGEASAGERRQITGIFRDVSAQRQLEQELLAVTDEERSHVGYQLHEGLGQMLTGIGLITRSLYQKLRAERHPSAEEALQIIDFLHEADQYAKDLSQGLIPVDGEETGLTYALQRLALHTSERYGLTCTFRQEGASVVVHDHAIAAHLYQIAQEAATMLARYAGPAEIHIVLSGSAANARIVIRYSEASKRESADEAALERWQKILSYRARVIGAILRIRRTQGGGMITCTIPVALFAQSEDRV